MSWKYVYTHLVYVTYYVSLLFYTYDKFYVKEAESSLCTCASVEMKISVIQKFSNGKQIYGKVWICDCVCSTVLEIFNIFYWQVAVDVLFQRESLETPDLAST